MIDPVKVLKKAKGILRKNKWIKGHHAYSSVYHVPVNVGDTRADSFCALGALARATYPLICTEAICYLAYAVTEITETKGLSLYVGVTTYNDSLAKSKKEILKLFDVAIELAEKDNV